MPCPRACVSRRGTEPSPRCRETPTGPTNAERVICSPEIPVGAGSGPPPSLVLLAILLRASVASCCDAGRARYPPAELLTDGGGREQRVRALEGAHRYWLIWEGPRVEGHRRYSILWAGVRRTVVLSCGVSAIDLPSRRLPERQCLLPR